MTRVTGLGGFIMNDRLNGYLFIFFFFINQSLLIQIFLKNIFYLGQIAITRALGDHLMKEYVISDPYVSMTPVTENDKFVIVACDGVQNKNYFEENSLTNSIFFFFLSFFSSGT